MNIVTNHQARDLIAFSGLPADAQAQFDYITPDDYADSCEYRFVRYQNTWYDMGGMMRAPVSMPDWDGVQGETYFSGVLFKLLPNGRVIAGHYYN